MQNKKNSFQVEVNKNNQKVVNSVHKNNKPFLSILIITEIYRLNFDQLFAHFRPVKFWSCDRVPPNSVYIKNLKALTLCPNFSFAHPLVFEL